MYVRNVKKLVALILCTFICVIVLLQFTCTYAFAQQANVPKVQEKTFVYDQEELLSTDQKETLNTALRYLEEQTSIEFAVITSSSYFGMNIDDYAHDLFNTLKIGKADKDNGILLLVSANEGHSRLEIGYGGRYHGGFSSRGGGHFGGGHSGGGGAHR